MLARDKLGVWKKVESVALFNESFIKIITVIPNISREELIDRYMRDLKNYVPRELCTRTYQSLLELMSDALCIEASKNQFSIVSTASSKERVRCHGHKKLKNWIHGTEN